MIVMPVKPMTRSFEPAKSRFCASSVSIVVFWLIAFLISTIGAVAAEPSDPVGEAEPAAPESDRVKEFFDRVWSYPTLYENIDNPVLKKLRFRGRFQADFPLVDANRGDYDEPQVRRFRLGLGSQWGYNLVLHAETDLDVTCDNGEDCDDDSYEGLTDAYIAWAPAKAFELKLGKISAPFTLDGSTSSKRLLTPERDNVSNNLWFPREYHTGFDVAGRVETSRYRVGVYSSTTGREFGDLDGGYFTLLSYSHDFSKRLDVAEFLVSVNYVYNKSDHKNEATRDLNHVFSLNMRFDTGRWGIRSDLSGAIGYQSQSDLIGFALVPFYNLTEKFQLVCRYTYLHSYDGDGIRLGRYENRTASRRGDDYDEAFAGVNWLIYGHFFKLQTGLKYTWMDAQKNYRGWGWTTAVRTAW
jgi:phosphate-selective porin OprO/OprP